LLLSAEDPPPFELVRGTPASRYVVTCDHASKRIPRALGSLGLEERDLARHIAWDIGAAAVARGLARALDATLVLQNYSRLVIDCNRAPGRPDSIAKTSEDTPIPGNASVSADEAHARAVEIFEPYHACIRSELERRAAANLPTTLVFMHTFTPVFRGVARSWHAGVLHLRDARLARPVLAGLRADQALAVGENEPYAASELTDYGLVEHAEKRGLLYVELEVRQDLLLTDAGVASWTERLARVLGAAASELGRG
jgi:predicted N-formylglutamate amidohydrolase